MKNISRADTFFSEEEKDRIRETTEDVEARTIGEIAVMVVDSSDEYLEAEVLGGIFFGSLVSLVATFLFLQSSLWFYITLSFLLFLPFRYLFQRVPILKGAFIGAKRMEIAVMQRAARAFYEKGLYRTRENTGVLFFISMLERKVWVLADKGICEKIDQDTLKKFAGAVSRGIKEGHACDALCNQIREAGELLAKHFPVKPGDTDELPDQVMTG